VCTSCVEFVALVMAQVAFASPLIPESPLGCPLTRTITIPPAEDAELVLAQGPQLISERVAGAFDSPRSALFD
jgi:hypothetical protein